ncbi:arginine/serine-rich coiled-coil protein 2-like [Dendrobium catenatum]|uniref:arginine/serine-rich coiled-coil protein 2-like n=1 Tax=Dendrobium catenatum TaxID=906689 RepID=UPI0009F4D552|nr:arginine/serine-rich coiled-coil protein 2-like [Dendrobium catenatum]
MSTDQKKKLLWGGKKNSSEESGNRWDFQLFADRERQEKFNKLMGVKGEAIPQERKPDEKDVEKQKELQTDLEKQYTAGLRRRDGRTVGLGL